MPRSMTGYGAAQATGSRIAVEVEARSVNARALKVTLRCPSMLSAREPALEGLVRGQVRRGTLTLVVRIELLRPQDRIRIRSAVVEGLAQSLDALRRRGLIEGKLTPDALAAIPGAIETGSPKTLRPVDWRLVKTAVTDALARLNAMREREARHLVRELAAIVRRMGKTLGGIKRRAPAIVREHHARLRERIDALLRPGEGPVDGVLLAREVAVMADRSDITEEITRLAAHLDEFGRYLSRGGEIGRTLDFLCQEILREVNTIGSKSGDVAVTRSVIALKSDVDRLKEQVANLE